MPECTRPSTEQCKSVVDDVPLTPPTDNTVTFSNDGCTTNIKMGGVLSGTNGQLVANGDSSVSTEDEESSSNGSGTSPKRFVAKSEAEKIMTAGDARREAGNVLFKKGDFIAAIQEYSKAIESCQALEVIPDHEEDDFVDASDTTGNKEGQTDDTADNDASNEDKTDGAKKSSTIDIMEKVHLCYANRALCHIKMENYGLAVIDAEMVIQLNPSNPKGYYRRGCALMCLAKYSVAAKDFQMVCKLTKNVEAEKRLKECNKQIRQERFSAAITRDKAVKPSTMIDLAIFSDTPEYTGPSFQDVSQIDEQFLKDLINYIKVPGNILHKKYAYIIVLEMIKLLQTLPTLVKIEIPPNEELTVCGDTHGQFYDLANIFDINGLPSTKNPYLFNGDFVDRGSFSIEVILTLFTAKLLYPKHVHLSRGNHETKNLNKMYGFMGEVKAKYDETLYTLFCECFCHLPLAHTVNSVVFIVHGGLFSQDGVVLSDIEKINRDQEPPDEGLMVDMLWSDPQQSNGRTPSHRGVSCQFGPDVTKKFLADNNLDYIIRSHEVKMNGYDVVHDGKVITIFSAPNYCDQMNNKGAFIRLNGSDLLPKFTTFDAVEHPKIPAMKYAAPLFSF